jgi:arylsulfatase A-like enzyme
MLRRLLDSPWPYFVAAGVLLVLAIASQFEVRFPSRSQGTVEDIAALKERDDLNVVFILVDTLRADRIGVYGYERPTSPTIDELARHGIVFKHVTAQSSWTKSSMASLWTGTFPANNGMLRYNHALPHEATLPAEIFREAGFRTAGIWRNGWVAPNFGFDQGFQVYHHPKAGRERAKVQRRNPSSHPLLGTDEDLIVSAQAFLDNFGGERFFLYMHFMDVHQYLYDEASAKFGTSYSDAYDQSIHWTDRLINVLIQKLDEVDLLSKTVIVLGSDHGEAFEEHGKEGHAKNLYREVVEVPFIITLPFVLDPGIAVDALVSNLDMWPTVLDLVGLPPLPEADGASLLPLILEAGGAEAAAQDTDPLRERLIFSQLDRFWGNPKMESNPLVSVRDGDLQLFMWVKAPDQMEFYDRAVDPNEFSNLLKDSDEVPPALDPLRAAADEYLANARSPWGKDPQEIELDAMKLEQLRALGYVIK